jgi:hypothetical protein
MKAILFALSLVALSCATGIKTGSDSGIITAGEVLVTLVARAEAQVEITGDFTAWQPQPMTYNSETGQFEGTLLLEPGEYSFKILENNRYLSPENFPELHPALTYTQSDGSGSTVGIWVVE